MRSACNCRSITQSYYRNSVGALLVFDVTNRDSFEHLLSWANEARTHVVPRHLSFVLVGQKCDLENRRKVRVASALLVKCPVLASFSLCLMCASSVNLCIDRNIARLDVMRGHLLERIFNPVQSLPRSLLIFGGSSRFMCFVALRLMIIHKLLTPGQVFCKGKKIEVESVVQTSLVH